MTPSSSTADRVHPRPIDSGEESWVFFRLRWLIAASTLRGMLRTARLRVSLLILLSALFWGSLFGLLHEAFTFVDSLHAEVISLLFNAFFSSLMVMLVFSTGILLYSGLYTTPEARLLLTLPVRSETIFSHKFQEAFWFSSWGFILLGSPMLTAYGVVRQAPWPYYLLLLPFMVAFVAIPATLGGIVCLALVAWMPRLRLHAVSIALGATLVAMIGLAWMALATPRADAMSAAWFEQVFSRLSITEQRMLPSWWLSSGIIEAAARAKDGSVARHQAEALRYLAVLVSNALMVQLVGRWVAGKLHRLGASQLVSEVPTRRKRRMSWFDEFLSRAGTDRGRPLRLLIVKDLRIFRRDISQWSQFVIFFGLLGLYFWNVRSFNYQHSYAAMIGFLNLAVVGLILSTFTTRFVFPMISLEGRRFWILGLLPVNRDQIVWSKFLFSFVGGIVPCCILVLLSDTMLGVGPELIAIHEVCCVVLCAGLSGIAVGIGARMPDLRETSPSKIASGFGGTLSLVISSLFIIAVVLVTAIPVHLRFAAAERGIDPARWLGTDRGVALGLAVAVLLGVAATVGPMLLGLRAFRRLEP
jgi:ABC-2 type transport system permease protein